MIAKRALDAPQILLGALRLDRLDILPISHDRERETRARAASVDQHGAGTADPVFAADMGAGELQFVPQEIAEEQARLDTAGVRRAVDVDRDADRIGHAARSQA